jgi:hypothetical protein
MSGSAEMEKFKKIEKAFERSYGPIVIWLDDLEEIVDLLKQYAGGAQIRTEDYQYEGLDDLKRHVGGRPLSALTITNASVSTDPPSVSLELTPTSVELRVFEPQGRPEAAKLFYEIDQVVTRCVRRFAGFYGLGHVELLPPIALFFLFQLFNAFQNEVNAGLAAILGILTFWSIWATFIKSRWTAVIHLQRRAEVRSFLERNKDQLLLLLIGAIIGGCVTFAGVVVKEHFYPSTTSCASKP